MNHPAVLLVDEPTSALDHERGTQIIDLIADLTHDRKVATVMVTHDHSQLDRVDSVHEMNDGRVMDVRTRQLR
jgi:putative ABC transport system ATP-binding protein